MLGKGLNGNIKFTPEGGLAVLMINKTGSATVKGDLVHASSTTDNGFTLSVVDVPDPLGAIYESGIPDGQLCWVVIAGIAEVNFVAAVTRGYLARGFITGDSGYVAGKAMSEAVPTSPFSGDKHFYEIGHTIQTTGGAGLAKIIMHFN